MKIIHIIFISASVFLTGCSGCSKSGQKQRLSHQSEESTESRREERPTLGEKTVVKMEKINGVFQIPVEVDGVKMYFIFDTGASIISISETEANFLWKQGKLTKDDIVGTANFSDANGDISEGTIIILTTVKIGDRILKNVEASVVHNLNAPLLFGQSALGKFGKISIDNNRGEITFE
jgi:aspartyl protease family protein